MSALPKQYNVDSPEELGRRIRAARKAQGLTQVDLAEIAGVGPRFLSELERGKDTVRLGLALKIARLVGLDPRLFDACSDLYANAWQRARFFILPTLQPAIVAGFFLALTLSIDDFVISYFTSGPESVTLPIFIWSAIKRGISPEINAIATLMIGTVLAAAAITLAFQYVRHRQRGE